MAAVALTSRLVRRFPREIPPRLYPSTSAHANTAGVRRREWHINGERSRRTGRWGGVTEGPASETQRHARGGRGQGWSREDRGWCRRKNKGGRRPGQLSPTREKVRQRTTLARFVYANYVWFQTKGHLTRVTTQDDINEVTVTNGFVPMKKSLIYW